MNLQEQFKAHWKNNFQHLLSPNAEIIVASSGGLDSTVLAFLLKSIGVPIVLAHVNFQLRGEESNNDEKFVRLLGEQLSSVVIVKHFDTELFATNNKLSIQEAARMLRYNWFAEIINEQVDPSKKNSRWLATAHHADDSIETMMMHFFRGTGIEGLKGIPATQLQKKIIRPLLPFFRLQLETFATAFQINHINDSSNLKNDYTRNFFRNLLIPQIEVVFPNVKENVLNNAFRLSEATILYKQSVNQHLLKLLEYKDAEVHIPILKWIKTIPLHTITWEMIKPFGFAAAQTNEVLKLSTAANGSSVKSSTHQIFKNRGWLIIAPLSSDDAQFILIEKEGIVNFQHGSIDLSVVPNSSKQSVEPNVEWLNADIIQFPLLLRKWKIGDYFYPLGMTKKKKIAKFLIDAKLSKTEKDAVWVLEMNQKIICVIGQRIDNRFKLSENTQHRLKINYLK